jgi:hypothetical protein
MWGLKMNKKLNCLSLIIFLIIFTLTSIINIQESFAQTEHNDNYYIGLECLGEFTDDQVKETVKIIKNRFDLSGFTEAIIRKCGFNYILMELPCYINSYEAMALATTSGLLEIKDENGKVLLSGSHIIEATQSFEKYGRPCLIIQFNDIGTSELSIATQKNIGKTLAITLDGEEISLPVVQEPIVNGQAMIVGKWYTAWVKKLAVLLKAGNLPVKLKVLWSETSVTDAVQKFLDIYESENKTQPPFSSTDDNNFNVTQTIPVPSFDSYQWEVGLPGFVEAGEKTYFSTPKPDTSQLLKPLNGETLLTGNISFSWNPVSNATKYQFVLYNSQGKIALDTAVNKTSIKVNLGIEETITWKVRAGDNSGNWGPWSSVWSLTLKSPTSITDTLPYPSPSTHPLQGSLHCPDKAGYTCPSCLETSDYVNHFKGFNILTTKEDCYVRLITQDNSSIGNHNDCEVIIKGEKWLGLEDKSGRVLAEEINRENFDFIPANDFAERTINFPQDGYQYELADGGKEFRLYLSRNLTEAFKAVPWQNLSVEIKNQETNKVFTYQFEKGIFPRPYTWSNGVANYGQCVWWAAKRWVEEVDFQKLFPFYPTAPQTANVKIVDLNYKPKQYDILIDYIPGGQPGHYAFVEKVEDDLVYISQFNFIPPGEVYNHIPRFWNGNPKSLYYSLNPHNEYYFKYYYRD